MVFVAREELKEFLSCPQNECSGRESRFKMMKSEIHRPVCWLPGRDGESNSDLTPGVVFIVWNDTIYDLGMGSLANRHKFKRETPGVLKIDGGLRHFDGVRLNSVSKTF